MIVFVSDLHLSESSLDTPFDIGRFVSMLERIVAQAEQEHAKQLHVVMLGDIFELLKSQEWLEANLRPWEQPTDAHVVTVDRILKKIVKANESFFTRISELAKRCPLLQLHYIPGNHDLPLNTGMGRQARETLLSNLPLVPPGQQFPEFYMDAEHSLFAEHGHQFDLNNRYRRDQVPIGDAIVIDFLAQLPRLVAEKLGTSPDAPELRFLHEIGCLRPQSSGVIANWILAGLSNMKADVRATLREPIETIVSRLQALRQSVKFESVERLDWWAKCLSNWALAVAKRLDLSTVSNLIPAGDDDAGKHLTLVSQELVAARSGGTEYKTIVCGHTHDPVVRALDDDAREGSTYINTGTWSRVRQFPSASLTGRDCSNFALWEEETTAIVYSKKERLSGKPAQEIWQTVRVIAR